MGVLLSMKTVVNPVVANVEETSVECETQQRWKRLSKFLLAFSHQKVALQQKYPGLERCQFILLHFH